MPADEHTRCGQVFPVWEALGWVQWQGAPARDRMWIIRYTRCQAQGVRAERNGFTGYRCEEHEECTE